MRMSCRCESRHESASTAHAPRIVCASLVAVVV